MSVARAVGGSGLLVVVGTGVAVVDWGGVVLDGVEEGGEIVYLLVMRVCRGEGGLVWCVGG